MLVRIALNNVIPEMFAIVNFGQGGTTSAIIAQMNPKVRVHVVDIDANRIAAWNSESLPIPEPGLVHTSLCDRFPVLINV